MGLAPATGPIDIIRNFTKDKNTYPADQCTWQAKQDAPWLPNVLGDAKGWFARLKMLGYTSSNVPVPGSIMVYQPGQGGSNASAGHVAYVTSVNPDWTVNLDERNWGETGQQGSRQNVKWQGITQGFISDKGMGDVASNYELAYAKGNKAPAGGPNFTATGAIGAVTNWWSDKGLGLVQIAVGTLFVLAGVLVFALIALRGATGAAASVRGTVGRVRSVPRRTSVRPASPAATPVTPAPPARPAARPRRGPVTLTEERGALRSEIAAGNPRPKAGAALRARRGAA